jgi:DNA (cytosine-5)-methyltransferase 1
VSAPLVLSLFPGIGLLDMAFEEEGFCVVRGPDLLWGGDVRRFHPPAGKFDGVIGGPPCQLYGGLANFAHRWRHKPEHLIPEYERVVGAAKPVWALMENVPTAPVPGVEGYETRSLILNNRWLGEEQSRKRRFSLITRAGRQLRVDGFVALEHHGFAQTVTAMHAGERRTHAKRATGGACTRYTVEEALRLQGCPPDFFGPRSPYMRQAQLKMLAEGVPLPMGRAIARAVKRAMYKCTCGYDEAHDREEVDDRYGRHAPSCPECAA